MGPDRPLPSLCGLSEPRRPSPSTSRPCQEDSDGFAAQATAEPHSRDGNLNALFGNLAEEYGPVFQIRPPFSDPMIFLAGLETNRWVHKRGRMYLRARDYFSDFEKVYGASGVLPALTEPITSGFASPCRPPILAVRLGGQLDQLYNQGRKYMASLTVGDSYRATSMCREMVNAQLSPLFISVDTQDLMGDLMAYKERALSVHIAKLLPDSR